MTRKEMQSEGHEERIDRLEVAVAALTATLYQVSSPEQVGAGGKQALAAILRDRRRGALETTDPAGLEERRV
jgi:hypothetical protein